jgi:NAD(P)-dependent dehydrogenase (short-subunit alcohol dehydrogenase family)
MTSEYWDAGQAHEYHEFQYRFPEKTLARKATIVSGDSGGRGASTVALRAREGTHLVIGYCTNRDRAEALCDALESALGWTVSLVAGDIASAEVREAYLTAAQKFAAPLAGVIIFPGDPARVAFENLNRETLLASLESNYVGPILLAKELGTTMESSAGGGCIVLLATMQALAVLPSSLNYAAPKAALVHAARILAQQWSHVRVNVVAPGASTVGMATANVQSGIYDRHLANGAVSRFGRSEDVARAVRFLLEPDRYITGQAIAVDGGLTLRRDRA